MRTFSKHPVIFLIVILLSELIFARDPVRAKHGMVASASAPATDVGVMILEHGGNAVDAAVAVGFAMAVTYPAAGNIGGGGFMVICFPDGKSTTFDFREMAPSGASRDMFLDENGDFLSDLSQKGYLASGVPGSVAGLIYAHEIYGSLPFAEVIQPAIDLAENGFVLDYKSAEWLNDYREEFLKHTYSAKIFTKSKGEFTEGEIFRQPDLAKTLRLIRDFGRDGFYKGETADSIASQMKRFGGLISKTDLEDYRAVERTPITGKFNGFEIISMSPPSSGGIALVEALNVLQFYGFDSSDWGGSSYLHILSETLKYVYADRSKHLGDPDFYPVPLEKLVSDVRAHEIVKRITFSAVPSKEIFPAEFNLNESESTTHFSVMDSSGLAVSVTTTLNSWFGNKIVVGSAGFLLNNEMDDFSAKPVVPNQFGLLGSEANSIQPGKRMLSSMTPTIVTKNGKPFFALGSPGGATIITVVLQTVLNVLQFNMNIQDAVDKPKIHQQWFPDRIDYEAFGMSRDVQENLAIRGQIIGKERKLGRVNAVYFDSEKGIYYGATDPRGFGKAKGF